MNLLLLSSSRVGDSAYLETAKELISQHFSNKQNIVFVPYAGVTISWDDYTAKVQAALPELTITGLHSYRDPVKAIQDCDGILVGGGNTFQLLNTLYQQSLHKVIFEHVSQGTPYAGWSAGANIAGNSIRTTNDMPIVQPPSFAALQLVPFQINPHYTEYQPPGHNGETREDRLREFMVVAPNMPVVAIPEGVALIQKQHSLKIHGELGAYLFAQGEKSTFQDGDDLSYLLQTKA
ncbi:MAG: dipeptidase PepE [Aestuariibacter sp.]